MEKVLGLSRNTAASLSYLLFFLSGLFFLVTSKDSFVRFHALQSTLLFIFLFAVQWGLMFIPFTARLDSLIALLTFCMWLLLIYKAWKGEEWEVPLVGDFARKIIRK
jgi:uncharacterized membrane protein